MGNAAIIQELSDLRTQVEELKQARNSDQKHSNSDSEETTEKEPGSQLEIDSIKQLLSEKLGAGNVEAQLQEFIATLEEEIKDTKPMTILGIFALGVLAGRLLPK